MHLAPQAAILFPLGTLESTSETSWSWTLIAQPQVVKQAGVEFDPEARTLTSVQGVASSGSALQVIPTLTLSLGGLCACDLSEAKLPIAGLHVNGYFLYIALHALDVWKGSETDCSQVFHCPPCHLYQASRCHACNRLLRIHAAVCHMSVNATRSAVHAMYSTMSCFNCACSREICDTVEAAWQACDTVVLHGTSAVSMRT